jgi:hypothetical protein
MAAIEAVELRGGPCDGDRPEPLDGTTFPDRLQAITVMDYTAYVGHVYAVTADTLIDDDGVARRVFAFERTVDADLVRESPGCG